MNIEYIEFIVMLLKYNAKYSKDVNNPKTIKYLEETVEFLGELEDIINDTNNTNNSRNPKS